MGIFNWIFGTEKEAEEFYTECLHKYRDEVYWIIFRYVKQHQTAEDLMQETMYKAMKKAHQLRDRSNSRSWLLKIARNQARQYIRDNDRKRLSMFGGDCPEEIQGEAVEPSALEELMRKCDAELLRDAFLQLDEETGIIIWLHVEKGDTFERLAEILEMNPKTVATKFYRGKDKIAAYIKEKEGE